MEIILITAPFALGLAFVLGLALGFFQKVFAVPQDPLTARIREALPGVNCGACGFPGCDGYAAAAASGAADINRCTVGGTAAAEKLAAITGKTASVVPVIAVLACRGSRDAAPLKGEYSGLKTCRGAKLSAGGTKLCSWGCLGFGDCVKACQFGALRLGENGLPSVDYAKCTGCKLCVAECPQGLLRPVPRDRRGVLILCTNRNTARGRAIKACKAACIKCGLCVKVCPEKCLTLEGGLPAAAPGKCRSCGICVAKCPTKVLRLAEGLRG